MVSKLLQCVLLSLLLFPAAAAAQASAMTSASPTLKVGDVVRIAVMLPEASGAELSGEFPIGEDGTIVHPLYRQINVLGKQRRDIEGEIERLLDQRVQENPDFVIEMLFRISVAGEVNNPNVFTVPSYTTVSEALMLANGPTDVADLRKVLVIRNGQQTHLDLSQVHTDANQLRIQSGDQIILVPGRQFWRDTASPFLSTFGSIASIVYASLRITKFID